MMGPQYLCCLYLATAGQQGPNLGSDEQEIVLLIYVIVEISQNKIIGMRQYLVKPTVADVNENVLSDQIQTNTFLTEELVKTAGQPLESAIFDFDRYIYTTLNVDPNTSCFRLVTDGQLPLRQCLHPETCSKNIELPKYYTVFHDIRKEVFKFIQTRDKNNVVNQQQVNNTKQQTLLATMNANNVANFVPPVNGGLIQTVNGGPGLVNGRISPVNDGLVVVNGTTSNTIQLPQSVEEMLEYLEMKADTDNEYYVKEAKDIVNIVQRLISSGHRFDSPETVNLVLEPGICSKDDEIDGNCVVRARGLPWQSSDQDIAKFFRGLNVAKGGVALCLSPQGRRNGEAVVRFCSQEHRDMALKRHKHHIGIRYIEVYRASGEDFLAVAGGSSNEAQTFLSKGANVIIRMRGLPYDCTSKQVLDFFASGEQPCQVLDGADGVLFVKKPDGRATGDAFVLFEHEADAPRALSKHRELIGSRYIELFRSTTAEVQQVLNRSMDPKTYEPQQPLIAQMPQMPLLPQHIITSGTRKDCIRLRGLPYEAQVEHILEFLGDHAKNIVYQGVHMVYNAQGQPSGEAFIQMDSEKSAYLSAHQKHHRYMVFGKKQRYIEVFQCSGEDMSMVLTGGIPAPVSPSKGATALLSPGGTLLPPGAAFHPGAVPATSGYGPGGPATAAAAYGPAAALPIQCPPPTPGLAHGRHPTTYYHPPPIFYWPYPSPPVSPTNYYAPAIAHAGIQGQPPPQQALIPADCIQLPTAALGPHPGGSLQAGIVPEVAAMAIPHNHHRELDKNGGHRPGLQPIPTPIGTFAPPPNYVEIFMA